MKKQAEPTSISKERPKLASAAPGKQARQRIVQRAAKSTSSVSGSKRPGDGGVAAVDRALTILGAFQPADQRLTLAELAQRTRFYKSTILRISQSLLRYGYLRHLDDGNYQIGPKPLMLGAIYQRSLRLGDILLPLMHELADQTGESVSFYSRHGD